VYCFLCVLTENLTHLEGKFNPSDLLIKILGWAKFWLLIQLLLFWKGETILPEKALPEIIKEIKAQTIKDKEKDPTSALRGVSGGVNPSAGSDICNETTWAGSPDPVGT
jgi:hypothetical protein